MKGEEDGGEDGGGGGDLLNCGNSINSTNSTLSQFLACVYFIIASNQ